MYQVLVEEGYVRVLLYVFIAFSFLTSPVSEGLNLLVILVIDEAKII